MWYSKKQKKKTQADASAKKVSGRFGELAERYKRRWADWMQRQSEKCSQGTKKFLLVAGCLLAGGYFVLIMVRGFDGLPHPGAVKQVRLPELEATARNKEEAYARINAFRNWLDSLKKTEGGIKVRDSLFRARPGLLDSLYRLEKIYDLTDKKREDEK